MSAQTLRRSGGAQSSLGPRLGRQLGRVVVIVLASALVTWGTILLASGPAGPSLTTTMAPAVAKPGGAPKPSGAPTAGQPAQAAGQAGETATAPARPPAGAPGGRNVPSLQRGMPDLLKYGGVMAGMTLAVVLVLRARRLKPRRRPASMGALGHRP